MPSATTVADPAYRLTPQRAAVLEVVRHAHDHPSARDIYERVLQAQPGIGFATVYRALALLVAHGDVRELQLGDEAVARYDGNTAEHHHVVCTGCGAAADVTFALPVEASQTAAAATGYQIAGADVRFLGRCPTCALAS